MAIINIGEQSNLREMEKRISMATKSLTPKKGQKLEYALINPVAPMGESSTVLPLKIAGKKKFIKIQMKDKVFVMPEKWETAEKIEIRKKLIIEGWQDCTKCVESVPQKKSEKPVIYIAGHPDNEPNNPKQGEFVLKYNIGRKKIQVKLTLVNGLVETTDKRVFSALINQEKFTDYGRKELKAEEVDSQEEDPLPEDSSTEEKETQDEEIQFD